MDPGRCRRGRSRQIHSKSIARGRANETSSHALPAGPILAPVPVGTVERVSQWVFPVPGLPTNRTFSLRSMNSQRASSVIITLFTDGRAENSKLSRGFSTGKWATGRSARCRRISSIASGAVAPIDRACPTAVVELADRGVLQEPEHLDELGGPRPSEIGFQPPAEQGEASRELPGLQGAGHVQRPGLPLQ